MGLLDIPKKPIAIEKTSEIGNLHKEYECEIDLDTAKAINTNHTRKSRFKESSPNRVFDTRGTRLTQEEYDFLIAIMNKHTNGKLKFDWNNLKKKLWEMSEK